MIKELFALDSTQAILTIPIPFCTRQDRLIWLPDAKGIFPAKLAYKTSFSQSNISNQAQPHWKKLWKAKSPKRLKMLIWRIRANSIPTRVNLQHRIHHIEPSCVLCNSAYESCIHLFFYCPIAKALWTIAGRGPRVDTSTLASYEDIIKLIMDPPKSPIPTEEHWTISLIMALIIDEI